ncbi:Olfactory Receptor 8B8 [Manis pentadactyla]|nr:Olfactory Receptor 8B8 [Manis pentadactyla]
MPSGETLPLLWQRLAAEQSGFCSEFRTPSRTDSPGVRRPSASPGLAGLSQTFCHGLWGSSSLTGPWLYALRLDRDTPVMETGPFVQ